MAKNLKVNLVDAIRKDAKFDDLETLKQQMFADKRAARLRR